MQKQTLEEWRAEATARFGERGRNWQFICPACGNVQSAQDFIDKAGVKPEEAVNIVFQNCIGRYAKDIGCDWAAYGLFKTMGKGRVVLAGDREVEAFDFAPAAEVADDQSHESDAAVQ